MIVNLGNTMFLPIVYQELSPKLEKIARMLVAEVTDVERIFEMQQLSMAQKSMSDALIWSGKLRTRLTEQTKYFELQKVKLFSSEYGHNATVRYSNLLEAINRWDREYIETQLKAFQHDTEQILNNPLLTRNENKRLKVNVGSKLDDIFQGINRMTMNEIKLEDQSLQNVWNQRSALCELKIKLERITEWYNYAQFQVSEQEKILLTPNSAQIDEMTDDFLTKYTWKNYDNEVLNNYIATLKHLYKRIKMVHDKMHTVIKKMHTWCDEPFFQRCLRTDENPTNLLNVNNRAKVVADRYKLCSETQDLIRTVMQENYCLLKDLHIIQDDDDGMHIDQQAIWPLKINKSEIQAYLPYEQYIDEMVCSNILTAIEISLQYIYNEIRSTTPLFEVCFSLDVENRKSIFQPSMYFDEKEGFVSFITTLMVDIFGMAVLLKRVPMSLSEQDYMPFVKENSTIEELRLNILVQAKNISKETLSLFEQYQKYSFIWIVDRNKYMAAFLKYGRQLTVDDLKKIDEDQFTEKCLAPSHDAFDNEIKRYRDLIPGIEQIPEIIDTAPWCRVKTNRFKTKLITEILKWTEMFKAHLHEHVTSRLNALESFIIDAKQLLANRCDAHELEKYRKMQNKMNEIDEMAEEIESMFNPLRIETMLLRKYGQEMSQMVKEQFMELPLWWKQLKNQQNMVRNYVEPVRLHQKQLTSKRIKLFEMRLNDFNRRFHNQAFFQSDCKNAYEIIDNMLEQILRCERTSELLDIYAKLFHIDVALSNSLIQQLHKEVRVLKQVWDYWYSLQYRRNLWAKTLWSDIDVEAVETECKRLSKEVRGLDKCCKKWQPLLVMENEFLNLLTSLRVLTSIQNPSIKERHFDELRTIAGHYFEINEKTTFDDLVQVKVGFAHNFYKNFTILINGIY